MKKLFLTILSLCLMASAWAASFTSGGIAYTITSASEPYTVSVATNPSVSGNISIPTTVVNNGITYAVTSIGASAFMGCEDLTSITIPSSVTSIGASAFSTCVSLTSVTIPSSVTSIETYTFYNCYILTSVTIPASVTSIAGNAFYSCMSLTSIYAQAALPISLSANPFNGVNAKCVLHVPVDSKTAYAAANYWNSFTNIVEDISTATFNATASNLKVNTTNGKALISGLTQGASVVVYNLQGVAIYNQKAIAETLSVNLPARGVYVVTMGNESVKVEY